jgi:hypothetical protein
MNFTVLRYTKHVPTDSRRGDCDFDQIDKQLWCLQMLAGGQRRKAAYETVIVRFVL